MARPIPVLEEMDPDEKISKTSSTYSGSIPTPLSETENCQPSSCSLAETWIFGGESPE